VVKAFHASVKESLEITNLVWRTKLGMLAARNNKPTEFKDITQSCCYYEMKNFSPPIPSSSIFFLHDIPTRITGGQCVESLQQINSLLPHRIH
jgi:hypothetical protein